MKSCIRCNYSVANNTQAELSSFVGPCANGHDFSGMIAFLPLVSILFFILFSYNSNAISQGVGNGRIFVVILVDLNLIFPFQC